MFYNISVKLSKLDLENFRIFTEIYKGFSANLNELMH